MFLETLGLNVTPPLIRTQQAYYPTSQLPQLAKDRFDKYNAIQPAAQPSPLPQRDVWKPPPRNVYKVNYDRAVFSGLNSLGVGVIIRNNEGLEIASLTERLNQLYQAAEIEALATVRALEFAVEIGLDGIVVEGT